MNSICTKVSLCIAIAIFASSCSYVTMQRPDKLEKEMPVCVSNRLAPSIDSTIAAASAISTIVFATIAADWTTRETSGGGNTAVAVGTSLFAAGSAVFGAAWTASAVSGFKRAKACEELKNSYYVDERRAAQH